MKFRSNQDGWITGLRFYKQPSNTGTHVGHLWSADGQKLAEVTFSNETASGWQEQNLPEPVQITKDTTYVTSYYAAGGRFGFSPGFFTGGVNRSPLSAPADGAIAGNGVYKYGPSAFPDATFGATNYWVDAQFEQNKSTDVRPPDTLSVSPAPNATRVPLSSKVEITFDEAVDPTDREHRLDHARDGRRRSDHRRGHLRRGRAQGHAHAVGVACLRHHVQGHDQERQRRRDRPRGQPADRGQDVDFRDGVGVPVHDLRPGHREARGAERGAGPAGRARRPLQGGRGRLHHVAALLQARQQRRRARRAPVGPGWPAADDSAVHRRDGVGLAERQPAESGRDHQGHGLHRVVLLAGRLLPARPGLLRQREGRRRADRARDERRHRERRVPLRRDRIPDRLVPRHQLLGRRLVRPHGAARHARAGGHRHHARLKRQRHLEGHQRHRGVRRADRTGLAHRVDVHAEGRRRRQCPGHRLLQRPDARRNPAPDRAARVPDDLQRHAQGRDRRHHGRRRQPPEPGQDVEVLDERPAADPGTGRPDPRGHRPVRPVRDLLRGDPPRRGPQQLRRHQRPGDRGHADRPHDRDPWQEHAGRGRRDDADQLGPVRREPDRDAPGQEARRAARRHGRRHDADERLHEGRPELGGGRRHRRRDAPVPRHGRPLHAQRRQRGRDALLDRDGGHREPGRHAARRRDRRRPGRGVHLRPRPLGRLHAPGQPRLGRAEAGRPGAAQHPPGRPVLRRQGRRRPA